MIGMATAVVTGLTLGHFIYQMLQTNPDWGTALERSFFQAVAIAVFVLVLWLKKRAEQNRSPFS